MWSNSSCMVCANFCISTTAWDACYSDAYPHSHPRTTRRVKSIASCLTGIWWWTETGRVWFSGIMEMSGKGRMTIHVSVQFLGRYQYWVTLHWKGTNTKRYLWHCAGGVWVKSTCQSLPEGVNPHGEWVGSGGVCCAPWTEDCGHCCVIVLKVESGWAWPSTDWKRWVRLWFPVGGELWMALMRSCNCIETAFSLKKEPTLFPSGSPFKVVL